MTITQTTIIKNDNSEVATKLTMPAGTSQEVIVNNHARAAEYARKVVALYENEPVTVNMETRTLKKWRWARTKEVGGPSWKYPKAKIKYRGDNEMRAIYFSIGCRMTLHELIIMRKNTKV